MGSAGILGGTFNPVHSAHVRHAVEVGEKLGLDRVLLMPNAVPPHKAARGLLPFELRVELLRAAVSGIPLLEVCTLEGELESPSYTWRSLAEFHRRGVVSRPEDLYLMLGVEDFAQLGSWARGLELPAYANLVVVPREGSGRRVFEAAGSRFWPDVWPKVWSGREKRGSGPEAPDIPDAEDSERVDVPLVPLFPGTRCVYMPLPRMDINATEIRRRWREGRCLNALLPDAELALMRKYDAQLQKAWG